MMNTSPTESCRECNSLHWELDPSKGEWVCPDCGETKQNLTSDEDSNQGSLYGENSQYQEVNRGDSAGGTLNLGSKKFTKDASGISANPEILRSIKRANKIAKRTDPETRKARKDAETKKLIEDLLRNIRPGNNENRNLVNAILKDRRDFVRWKNTQRRLTGSGVRIKNVHRKKHNHKFVVIKVISIINLIKLNIITFICFVVKDVWINGLMYIGKLV